VLRQARKSGPRGEARGTPVWRGSVTSQGHAEQTVRRKRSLRAARRLIAAAVLASAGAVLPTGSAAAQEDPPHVMVFSSTYGFHHSSIEYGNAVLAQLAAETGDFTIEFSQSPTDISAAKLAQVDLVLFNSTTGRIPLTQQQRDEFEHWLGCGGGFMGVHASADNNYGWPLYAELVGAQFEAHPQMATDPAARMLVEDQDHAITAPWHGEESFLIQDELYRWRRDPRGTQDVNVLLSLDETSLRPGIQDGVLPYVHHQPIAWTKTFRGASRVYYTNLGHNESTWDLAKFRQSLVAGIKWVGGIRPDATCLATGGSHTTGEPSFRYPDETRVAPGRRCPAVAGASVLRAGSANMTVAAPAAPLYFGPTRLNMVLDLSDRRAKTADLTSTLSWLTATDDYDLAITTPAGFGGSDRVQPVAPASEADTIRGLRHCDLVQIDVYNHAATTGLGLRLQLDVAAA
jgi:type 1 glutamine amidotransferase